MKLAEEYECLPLVGIPVECDELWHDPDRPYCGDLTCPCQQDDEPCKTSGGTLISTWSNVENWENIVECGPIRFTLSADWPQHAHELISALEHVREILITGSEAL